MEVVLHSHSNYLGERRGGGNFWHPIGSRPDAQTEEMICETGKCKFNHSCLENQNALGEPCLFLFFFLSFHFLTLPFRHHGSKELNDTKSVLFSESFSQSSFHRSCEISQFLHHHRSNAYFLHH